MNKRFLQYSLAILMLGAGIMVQPIIGSEIKDQLREKIYSMPKEDRVKRFLELSIIQESDEESEEELAILTETFSEGEVTGLKYLADQNKKELDRVKLAILLNRLKIVATIFNNKLDELKAQSK